VERISQIRVLTLGFLLYGLKGHRNWSISSGTTADSVKKLHAGIPEAPWTDGEGKQKLARCFWCCRFYAREQDLKGHLTKGCKCKPGSRTGSASEKALIKEKIKGLQKDVGKVYCEEHLLKNVYHFCYLGSRSRLPS
jgi:hypothetical protein